MRQLIFLFAILFATIGAAKAQYIPGPATRAGLGAAASGANTDITTAAGLNTPAGQASLGLQPRKHLQAYVEQGGTQLRAWGFGAPTPTGTATTVADPLGTFANYASSGAGTATAGWATAVRGTELRYKPVFSFKIKTGANATDITACRIFAGLTSNGNMTTSDAVTAHYIGVRYMPGTDATAFWRLVSNDGSGGPTTAATSLAIAVDTCYEFTVDATNPAAVLVYGAAAGATPALLGTITTELPGSTQRIDSIIMIGETEAVAKNIRIAFIDLKTN
jgi:hypothetical protein